MDYHNEVKRYFRDIIIVDSLEQTGKEIADRMLKTGETMLCIVAYNLPVTIINNLEEPRIRLMSGSLIIDINDYDTTVKDNLPVDHMSRWNLRNLAILLSVLHNLKDRFNEEKES